MTTEVAHNSTANASRCSCGKLWLDHCEILAIQNEKLTAALKEAEKWLDGVDMQKVGDTFNWSGNARAALKIVRAALKGHDPRMCPTPGDCCSPESV